MALKPIPPLTADEIQTIFNKTDEFASSMALFAVADARAIIAHTIDVFETQAILLDCRDGDRNVVALRN